MKNLVDKLHKRISICIWGEWLGGRIGENAYLLEKEEKKVENVILYFSENEKCTIVKPVNMLWNGKRLSVKSADKIIWEFYYYGKPQTPENLITIEYCLLDDSHVNVIQKGNWQRDEVIKTKGKIAIDSF